MFCSIKKVRKTNKTTNYTSKHNLMHMKEITQRIQ